MQQCLFDSVQSHFVGTGEPQSQLLMRNAEGMLVPASDELILCAARAVAKRLLPRTPVLRAPAAVKEFLAVRLNSALEHEVFGMVLLDARFAVIDYVEPFRGTLTQASVYPREVVKIALRYNAAALIIAHNHPSGSLEPSQADLTLTTHLHKALALVDIRLVDHVIVAGKDTLSFAETGHL